MEASILRVVVAVDPLLIAAGEDVSVVTTFFGRGEDDGAHPSFLQPAMIPVPGPGPGPGPDLCGDWDPGSRPGSYDESFMPTPCRPSTPRSTNQPLRTLARQSIFWRTLPWV